MGFFFLQVFHELKTKFHRLNLPATHPAAPPAAAPTDATPAAAALVRPAAPEQHLHDEYWEKCNTHICFVHFNACLCLPKDCKMATRLPDATPPPLAMAADDIIDDATDPAAMPPEVKPAAEITNGAKSTEQT